MTEHGRFIDDIMQGASTFVDALQNGDPNQVFDFKFNHLLGGLRVLNAEQLRKISINPGALELIPKSMAMENCVLAVSAEPDNLHVIMPDGEPNQIRQLLDKFEFILNKDPTFDSAKAELLRPIIELHYSGWGAWIQNCNYKVKYCCPLSWTSIQLTTITDVRHCTTCNKDVTFCHSQDQVAEAATKGKCVAFLTRETSLDHFEEGAFMGFVEAPIKRTWADFLSRLFGRH